MDGTYPPKPAKLPPLWTRVSASQNYWPSTPWPLVTLTLWPFSLTPWPLVTLTLWPFSLTPWPLTPWPLFNLSKSKNFSKSKGGVKSVKSVQCSVLKVFSVQWLKCLNLSCDVSADLRTSHPLFQIQLAPRIPQGRSSLLPDRLWGFTTQPCLAPVPSGAGVGQGGSWRCKLVFCY